MRKLQLTSSREKRSFPTQRGNKVPFQMPAKAVRKGNTGVRTGMEEIKLSWFTDDRIIYVENPKGLTKKLDLLPAPCGRSEESLPTPSPGGLRPVLSESGGEKARLPDIARQASSPGFDSSPFWSCLSPGL